MKKIIYIVLFIAGIIGISYLLVSKFTPPKIKYENTTASTLKQLATPTGIDELTPEDAKHILPMPPTDVKATQGDSYIYLTWKKSQGDIARYYVYRKSSQDKNWALVGDKLNNNERQEMSWSDELVEKFITYKYAVTAINLYGAESLKTESNEIGLTLRY